jgi:outer membrane immunogenic protein
MKTFKSALLAAALFIGTAAAANAADIYQGPSMKEPPQPYLPPLVWNGFYIGANVGGAFANNNHSFFFDGVKRWDDNRDNSTWIGGFQVGYNWQRSSDWVFGLEGDVDFADHIDYLASIRGRLGYASGNALFYGTGGVAFIGLNNDFRFNDGSNDFRFSNNNNATGWVAGGGIEYKLRTNMSLGVEGLFYNFNDSNDHFVDDTRYFHCDSSDFWTVRLRLNYFLNGAY